MAIQFARTGQGSKRMLERLVDFPESLAKRHVEIAAVILRPQGQQKKCMCVGAIEALSCVRAKIAA